MTSPLKAAVIHQPAVHDSFRAGVRKLALSIQPTLGPTGRNVAMSRESGDGPPELLDSGGIIARRMLQLPNRQEDIGAMFLRNLLWRIQDTVGDGTATASVIFHDVYEAGLRYLAAGGNPMRLRDHLQAGLHLILEHIDSQCRPLTGEAGFRQFARTLSRDIPLADELAEIFGVLGHHGQIEIRPGKKPGLESDFIEGAWWESPIHSLDMLSNKDQRRVDLQHCRIVLTNLNLETPRELLPLLQLARDTSARSIVLIANRVSAQCLAFLLSNSLPGAFDIIALKTPGITVSDRMEVLADLTSLTGGRPFHAAAGDSLLTVQLADLGGARRVWADRTHFGVIGGTGEPRARITYIRQLEREFDRACDDELRRRLSQRIGILTGSSAVVRIGGNPEPPVRKRIEDARQLVMSIRAAMRDGTVPGGGYALYSARHALLPAGRELDPDERAAQGILLHALEAPIRHILANAGHNFGHQVLVDLDEQDAMQMSVQGDAAGLIADLSDSALTTKTVVRAAIEGAAQALTIDTVVHHRYPEESIHP